MTTVLHLISSTGYYGAENMLVELATNLSNLGWRNVVAAFEDRRGAHLEVTERAQERGLATASVPCRNRVDHGTAARIRKLVETHDAAVLHTHGYKADLYGYAASWPRLAILVSTCHNWPDRRPLMRLYAGLDLAVLRRFDAVAAVSEPVCRTLRRWGVGATTVRNGVDLDRHVDARPTLRTEVLPGCDRLIGFVGRLAPEKGGAALLRAARRVIGERPTTGFVFVGDGRCRAEWEALAVSLGIASSVAFTGTRTDMPGVFASFDVVVLPSLIEAMPMCVLEAMAAGKAIVATKVGSVPELVVPGATGLLVDPGDENGLSAGVLRLLANQDFSRGLGAQARIRVGRLFSARAMASAYSDLYQRALDRGRPGSTGECCGNESREACRY